MCEMQKGAFIVAERKIEGCKELKGSKVEIKLYVPQAVYICGEETEANIDEITFRNAIEKASIEAVNELLDYFN